MKRFILSVFSALAMMLGTGLAAMPAQAASHCVGSSYSGYCYTVVKSSTTTTVVERVPVSNIHKSKTINANCGFSKTLSESQSIKNEAGVEVSAGIKAGVFASIDATVKATVSTELSQSASRATSAGGSFKLKPGEKVTCERTYSKVNARVKRVAYTGKKTTTTYYNAVVPSSFGVRFAN